MHSLLSNYSPGGDGLMHYAIMYVNYDKSSPVLLTQNQDYTHVNIIFSCSNYSYFHYTSLRKETH